jgi:Protein of unknown function (DUF3987)/Primase C terminal 2 (PriCT-2)
MKHERDFEHTDLDPDREVLAAFCHAMFKNADPKGFVSLRAYRDDGVDGDKAIDIEPIYLGSPDLDAVVFERARQAARWHIPAVFCPPVATFTSSANAKLENLREGVALSVECDQAATAALRKLTDIIGEPTIVVESGGEWTNPDTGEIEPKLHLHWRLARPSQCADEHKRLREARDLAATLVGGDSTNKSIVHPIRWPGSWHRKATPKLARIVSQADREIDLDEALALLREAAGSLGIKPSQNKANPHVRNAATLTSIRPKLASDPEMIGAALKLIPNDDIKWAHWNNIGLATSAAAGGDEVGRTAFAEWSAKSSKNNPDTTNARWNHYATSPPTRIGFGTLVYLARQRSPDFLMDAPATEQAEQVDPVDLWGKFDPPTLPRGVLPAVIEDFAFDQGMTMGGDMTGIATAALAVCAAAIPDKIQLRVKKHSAGWHEGARLWVALVGPVSAMKSPIISAAVRPLRRIDTEMARANQRAMADYNKLSAEERKQTEPPKQPRLMIQDTTIEAAQETLKDSPDGLLLYADELAGWFGSMDKYSGGRGSAKDRAFWLEAYNGAPYTVSRVGRGSVFIDNLSVSIVGGIQPEPIRKLADDSVDDGLLQRLVPIVLRPAVVGRDEEPSEAVAQYEALIGRLHQLRPPTTGRLMPGPESLRFDDGALAIREELERKHLELQQCESINRKLAAHIGKYNGLFARLCVVWHCVENAGGELPAVITEATARRAKAFLHGFLRQHAMAFYADTLGLSNDHDRLTAVAGYILAHKLERITNRDVQRGDRTMRGLERRDIEAIFDQLDALGWITRTPGPRPTDPPHWIVNPVVHRKFAERGQAEAERRQRERSTIAALGKGGE